jgi:poly(A) polymerase
MRRLLEARRIAAVLKAMSGLGLLPFAPDLVDLQHRYERMARRPEVAARLALVLSDTEPGPLRATWRLSNEELKVATAILDAARLLIDYQLFEAAYRHTAVIAQAVDVAATLAEWTDAGRLAVTDQLQALDIPRFPLSGNDLIASGMRPGRALGAELDRLERLWIESGFSLDRKTLLEQVRRPF